MCNSPVHCRKLSQESRRPRIAPCSLRPMKVASSRCRPTPGAWWPGSITGRGYATSACSSPPLSWSRASSRGGGRRGHTGTGWHTSRNRNLLSSRWEGDQINDRSGSSSSSNSSNSNSSSSECTSFAPATISPMINTNVKRNPNPTLNHNPYPTLPPKTESLPSL